MDILTNLKQVGLSLFSRRKRWVILAAALGLVLFLPAAYTLSKEPPRFRTSAVVYLENKAERVPIFQEFSPNRPLPVQMAILQSRALAEAVIEALPRASVEDLMENPYSRDYWLELQNSWRRLQGQEPLVESPQRRALMEMQAARVRFSTHRGGGIVEIIAEASKPRVALDIANTYMDVLVTRTRSFNIDDAKSTREYLTQQTGQVAEALNASETTLSQFTLSKGGIRVPDRFSETAGRLSQLESSIAEVQTNKNMSQTRLAGLRAKLEAMPGAPPKATPAAAAPSSVNTGRLRAKLSSLEAQLVEAKGNYPDDHPRLRSLRQQIADVQRDLGDAVKESTSADLTGSSVPAQDRAAFAEMVGALETSVVSLTAQESALREQASAHRKNLAGLSKDELEYRRLASEAETNRKLATLLQDKLGAARLREQGEMNAVKVIDPPGTPSPAPNERRLKFLGIALALSFVVGVAGPGVVEYFNRPIQTEHDARQITGLPVLSAVPLVQSRRVLFSQRAAKPGDVVGEDYILFLDAIRRLRVEIQLLAEEMPLHRILVASALPGEGKSTVVYNLGLALGEVGKRVIIADADFHRPTLHRTAKTNNERGFTDLLAGTGDLSHSLTEISDGVRLAPRGSGLTVPARAGLGTRRLVEVLAGMSAEADYVLIDSSPALLIPENLYVAAAADGIILVADSGSTRPRDLLRAKEVLEHSGTPVIGVVVNRMPLKSVNYYYRRYSAYYHN
ncbi:MAG: P-loop NTPase [Candidatus Rokubacteria bacterium]|nr:P-loop NTPase [Candidatus Rokubacteria bacterium]